MDGNTVELANEQMAFAENAVAYSATLSFIRGLVASINPCGFVLLPTYLMYFLGVSAANGEMQKAPISKALLVGATVSAGFLAVFFVAGGDTSSHALRELLPHWDTALTR